MPSALAQRSPGPSCSGLASPLQEVLILAPVGEACPAHTQVLHQSQVLDLVTDEEVVKLAFGEIEERVTGKAPSAPPKPSFQAAAPGWVQPQRPAIRPQLCFLGGRVLVSTDNPEVH